VICYASGRIVDYGNVQTCGSWGSLFQGHEGEEKIRDPNAVMGSKSIFSALYFGGSVTSASQPIQDPWHR
jgi:hypothetical protein